ncbi:hypothetical protein MGU_11256 [Metarhizium guizhouense ARSEF 977]|uniref:Uncharacterized protein n=1 Tax=Metarhizium guizhouense (strain ARSEF 977) TaxID=1276136 RepID=A0A0B4GV43_METGA|nr:hypothetical protein MGU_11256 [Metarhizium guizhouense ARSEF 977]
MPTTYPVDVSERATASMTEGGSRSRNIPIKRKRLFQPNVRKSPPQITKKKKTKKAPPRGAVRDFPCRPCVTRATKSPGHECASQDNTGAACWDCAKNGHTCKPVPPGARAAVRAFWDLNRQLCGANDHPDDFWRAAAQRAAQQLRAWGNGAASPAIPAQVPALASFGEVAEKGLEERKVIALETIAEALAEAVKLWIQLNQRDEEEEEDEDEDEDEEEENEDN